MYNTKKELRILIADDHPIFRRGLKQVIEAQPRMKIVYEAEDGEEALDRIRTNPPDIAILDIEMPKLRGLDIMEVIQREKLKVDVIFLTMYNDEYMFNRSMELGIMGYVLKDTAVTDIIRALQTVVNGKHFVSPNLAEFLVRRGKLSKGEQGEITQLQLTRTERKVLCLIAEAKTSKEIGELLGTSIKTVESHRTSIARKLKLNRANELIRFAIENKHWL